MFSKLNDSDNALLKKVVSARLGVASVYELSESLNMPLDGIRKKMLRLERDGFIIEPNKLEYQIDTKLPVQLKAIKGKYITLLKAIDGAKAASSIGQEFLTDISKKMGISYDEILIRVLIIQELNLVENVKEGQYRLTRSGRRRAYAKKYQFG